MGDAVVLNPGSEAEEAVLVTAAAGAVVGFLREIKRHPGGSNKFGLVLLHVRRRGEGNGRR